MIKLYSGSFFRATVDGSVLFFAVVFYAHKEPFLQSLVLFVKFLYTRSLETKNADTN